MSNLQIKLKLLFFPYLIISTSFIILYTWFHWLLIIHLKLFAPSELLITTGLPLVLLWMPTLFWMAPRIKLLSLYRDRGNVPLLYLSIVAFGPCLPTILTQKYLIVATGKLTSLQTISQVSHTPPSKYYTVAKHYIDKRRSLFYKEHYLSGKNKSNLNLEAYFICPIYDRRMGNDSLVDGTSDTVNYINVHQRTDLLSESTYWLGVKYEKQIFNDIDTVENENQSRQFYTDVQQQFKDTDLQKFDYLEHIYNSKLYYNFLAAINSSGDVKIEKANIFEARYGSFKSRSGYDLLWIFLSYVLIEAVWYIFILIPDIDESELANFTHGEHNG